MSSKKLIQALSFTLPLSILSSAIVMVGCSSGGSDPTYGSENQDVDNGDQVEQQDPAQDDSNISDLNIGDQISTDIGQVLIGTNDLTLYTFENDRNDAQGDGLGDSDCNDGCATTWPPVTALDTDVASGNYTIITRDDGVSLQWAFKGLPLYFFSGDSESGDVTGEGLGGTWFVARPDPFQALSSDKGDIIGGKGEVIATGSAGEKGDTRIDKDGFSLYVFDNDVNDSNGDGAGDPDCNGGCASAWPPLFADEAATASGNYSVVERDDGSMQWAFKGEPLYFFAGDTVAGATNGDQPEGTWHLARLAPVQLFTADSQNVFAARGNISDVDSDGSKLSTQSDKTGFALYTFDNDTNDTDADGAGDSDCNGNCAIIWPPLYAEENDKAFGDFTIITRDDESLQWAYQGNPLYFYSLDNNAGDTDGTAIPNWRLAIQ